MKYILTLLFVIFLTSCSTVYEIPEHIPLHNDSISWSGLNPSYELNRDIHVAKLNNKHIQIANLEHLISFLRKDLVSGVNIYTNLNSESTGSINQCCISTRNDYGLIGLSLYIDIWGKLYYERLVLQSLEEKQQFNVLLTENFVKTEIMKQHLILVMINQYNVFLDKMLEDVDKLLNSANQRTDAGMEESSNLLKLTLQKGYLEQTKIVLNDKKNKAISNLIVLLGVNEYFYSKKESYNEVISPQMPDVRSSVLFNRPDVKMAESQLIADNYNISVIRADTLPNINLNIETILYSGGSAVWKLFPSLAYVLFDNGVQQTRVDVSIAERNKSLSSYQLSIQNAFKDLRNVYSEIEASKKSINLLESLLIKTEREYQRTLIRFNSGYQDLSDVSDRISDVITVTSKLLTSQFDYQVQMVNLYSVMGAR